MRNRNLHKHRFNLLRIKFSGGALAYVVTISIVISMLMLGVLLMKYYFQLSLINDRDRVRATDSVFSGFNLVKNDPSIGEIKIDLYGKSLDSIHVIKRQWGFFMVATVGTSSQSLVRSAFIGDANSERPSLYIANNPIELRLFGNSSITGQVYVPNGRVKLGKIGEKSFSGSLSEDIQASSSATLPDLSSEVYYFIEKYKVKTSDDFKPRNVSVSFQDVTKHLHTEEEVNIYNRVEGNVIISSSKRVTIKVHSDIENAIFIAPKIIIEDNVSGQFQAIATDTLLAGKGVQLTYPSLLGVVSGNEGYLEVNSGYVQGGLILSTNKGRTGLLNLKGDIEIDGMVYSDNAISTNGVVRGSVYAKKTLLNYLGELSDNGINNTTISPNRRFGTSCYAIILDDTNKGEVLLWVD